MKKLLTILGAVVLTTSASSAVMSFTAQNVISNKVKNAVEDKLNDLKKASLLEAKGIITNNEYGISTKLFNDELNNYSEEPDAARLLGRYYGQVEYKNQGTGLNLGGTNGTKNGLDWLIDDYIAPLIKDPTLRPFVRNGLVKAKDAFMGLMSLSKGQVNTANVYNDNWQLYNSAVAGDDFLIDQVLKAGITYVNTTGQTDGTIKDIVSFVNKNILIPMNEGLNDKIPGFLANGTTGINQYLTYIRMFGDELLNKRTSKDDSKEDKSKADIIDSIYDLKSLKIMDTGKGFGVDANVDAEKAFDVVAAEGKTLTADDFITTVKVTNTTTKEEVASTITPQITVAQKVNSDNKPVKDTFTVDLNAIGRVEPIKDAQAVSISITSKDGDENVKEAFSEKLDDIIIPSGDPDKPAEKTGKVSARYITIDPTAKDFSHTKIEDINLKDAKKELLASLDRIGQIVFNFWTPANDDASRVENLENNLSTLILALINKTDIKTLINSNLSSEENIMKIVYEGLRIITIMNGQFNSIEDYRYDNSKYSPSDSKHLFMSDKTNYEFMNGVYGKDKEGKDLTFGSLDLIKDKSLNLNYFLSNLDYFLGDLNDGNNSYRIQQLLFLLMNDPYQPTAVDGNNTAYKDKGLGEDIKPKYRQSDILDLIINVVLTVGNQYVAAAIEKNPKDTTLPIVKNLLDGLKDPAHLALVKENIINPLILGLINGDDWTTLYSALVALYTEVSPLITQLQDSPLKKYINEIVNSVKRIGLNPNMTKDTIHSLFTEDWRPIIDGIELIPWQQVNMIFGETGEINLTKLLETPLAKILSWANVPGFKAGRILQVGDYFTTQSIPTLVSNLDRAMNTIVGNKTTPGIYSDVLTRYLVKTNDVIDYNKSMKSFNIDLQAIYDAIISIIGHDDAKDNIVSKLVTAILKITYPDNKVPDLYAKNKDGKYIDKDGNVLDDNGHEIPDKDKKDHRVPNPELTKLPDIQIDFGKFADALGIMGQKDDTGTHPDANFLPPNIDPAKPILQFKTDSIAGTFFRLFSPGYDQDDETGKSIKYSDQYDTVLDYMNTDLVKVGYDNFARFVTSFNETGYDNYYSKVVDEIIKNDDDWEFDFDDNSIKHFKNDETEISGFTYKVTYRNYVTNRWNRYTFIVSRNTINDAFKIDQLTTDKQD